MVFVVLAARTTALCDGFVVPCFGFEGATPLRAKAALTRRGVNRKDEAALWVERALADLERGGEAQASLREHFGEPSAGDGAEALLLWVTGTAGAHLRRVRRMSSFFQEA